jgi:nucleotide-binding universal stress UspA family protein
MKTIVVGYDGSIPARVALERAARFAEAFGSKVIVATVEELLPADAGLAVGGLSAIPVDHVPGQERAERLIAEARSYLARHGITVESASPIGPPVAGLVDVAEAHDADLIVVGTHDPGFFERLYRGSVSQGVARKARCDVLVVHPESEPES